MSLGRSTSKGTLKKILNATFTTLILKKVGAVKIKDFQPISLVGVVYKLIFKVLVDLINIVLGKVIIHTKFVFIRERQILDPVIASECLDGRLPFLVLGVLHKVDLEKAFDHINWAFLLFLLWRCGFGEKWVGWIVHCISPLRFFFVLVNGSPLQFF